MVKILNIILSTIVLTAILFVIFNLGKNNLGNPNLWFDESGQFWIAKGLNHYSQSLSTEGNVMDVIVANKQYNLDPGGFSILLHYWSKISNSPFWLRLLPFVFFISTVLAFVAICFVVSKSMLVSLLFGLVFLTNTSIIDYGFELRAYSMEYFGFALSIYLLLIYFFHPSDKKLLSLNWILAIFMTSRYSFFIFAAIVSLMTFATLPKKVKGMFFYLPQLLSGTFIMLVNYKQQFGSVRAPGYTNDFILKYTGGSMTNYIVKTNLISNKSIFISLLVILGFFSIIYKFRDHTEVKLLACFSFIYQLVYFSLSKIGVHPWFVECKWNLPLVVLNLICLVVLTNFMMRLISDKYIGNKFGKTYLSIFIIMIIFAKPISRYVRNLGHYFRSSQDSIYSNIIAQKIGLDNQFFIDKEELPTWKYLNEYGPFAENSDYPANTTLMETNIKLKDKSYVVTKNTNTDFCKEYVCSVVGTISPSLILEINTKNED